MKYRKNPSRANFCLNGVTFDDDTVVEGAHWSQWSQPMGNQDAFLAIAGPDEVVTVGQTVKAEPAKATEMKPVVTTDTINKDKGSIAESKGTASIKMGNALPKPTHALPAEPEPDPEPEPEPEPDPEEDEPESEPEPMDLTAISGVGESRAEALVAAGFDTVEEVAGVDPQELVRIMKANRSKVTLAQARGIVRGAKQLIEE